MSEAGDLQQDVTRTGIETRAADFIQRRRFWNWNADDDAALEAWLNESALHRVAFLRLEAGLGRIERLAALKPSVQTELVPEKWRPRLPLLLRVAAAVAVFALIGVVSAKFLLQPRERLFRTAVGGHETVNFADGSQIELNTATVLRARMTTEERIVWLDKGEAFFRIKHDPLHPFVVMVGDHRVTDLGTQFLVRRDARRLEVAVVQGRVSLDAPNKLSRSQAVLLAPGDVATASANTLSVRIANVRVLNNQLSWRRGVLVFDNATLADAAAEFNRYNREKLIIADPAAASMTIVGTFRTSDVVLFAHVTREALGLRIAAQGDDIVISSRNGNSEGN